MTFNVLDLSLYLITNYYMLGKAIATSFIILGIYIIFSFIANVGSKKGEEGAEQYHIGCYESSNPLEESLNIQLYLNNVSH